MEKSVYGRFLMVTCDVKHRLRYAHCRRLCKQSSGANEKPAPPVRPRTVHGEVYEECLERLGAVHPRHTQRRTLRLGGIAPCRAPAEV